MTEIELSIQGMTCASCAARVEKRLNKIGEVRATVNYATERASITAPDAVTAQLLINEVEQAGYGADVVRLAAEAARQPGPDDARAGCFRRTGFLAGSGSSSASPRRWRCGQPGRSTARR